MNEETNNCGRKNSKGIKDILPFWFNQVRQRDSTLLVNYEFHFEITTSHVKLERPQVRAAVPEITMTMGANPFHFFFFHVLFAKLPQNYQDQFLFIRTCKSDHGARKLKHNLYE